MGERVVHGVWAHCVQLRVPHAVLFGEQEGDKLSRNGQEKKDKVSTYPSLQAWQCWDGEMLSVHCGEQGKRWGERGGNPKENLAPGTQVGFWAAPPTLTGERQGSPHPGRSMALQSLAGGLGES